MRFNVKKSLVINFINDSYYLDKTAPSCCDILNFVDNCLLLFE